MYNRDKFGLDLYYPETPKIVYNNSESKTEEREKNNKIFLTMNCFIFVLMFVAPLIWVSLEALLIIGWVCNRLAIEFQ